MEKNMERPDPKTLITQQHKLPGGGTYTRYASVAPTTPSHVIRPAKRSTLAVEPRFQTTRGGTDDTDD
jgi:hypothetical protein